MVTYYIALGSIGKPGKKNRVPKIIHQNKKYELSIPEFIIWSSVCWNIYDYEELKKVFEFKCEKCGCLPDFNFDYYLQSLENRSLIKSGKGCTAITALYSLLLELHIRPINNSFGRMTLDFLSLILKLSTFEDLRKLSDNPEDDDSILNDKVTCNIWNIVNKIDLSVAEAICCVKNNISNIDEDSLIEKVYGEKYDYKTIGAYAQMQDEKYTVLTAIVNLYFKKMLIFEM